MADRLRKNLGVLMLVALAASLPCRATAALLLYEPFGYSTGTASGTGVLLSGQNGGTGFAAGSSWSTSNTGTANSVTVYQQGNLSGVNLSTGVANTFDGLVSNLPTSGGYFGSVGLGGTANTTDHMFAWRTIDPSVTATFLDGTSTWMSYVSARAFNLNASSPKLAIGAGRLQGDRGYQAAGEAIGMGGGVGSNTGSNTLKVYGQFWDNITTATFDNYDPTGKQTGTGTSSTAVQVPTQAFSWATDSATSQPIANIVIAKMTWSDSGPDILKVARFVPSDGPLSEAMFDAIALSSATWPIQPSLAQSTFNTISIAGARYFADEFRIATTFAEVVGAAVPEPSQGISLLAGGGACLLGLARRRGCRKSAASRGGRNT